MERSLPQSHVPLPLSNITPKLLEIKWSALSITRARSAHARSCQTNGAFTLLSLAQALQLPRLLPHLSATPSSVSPSRSPSISLCSPPPPLHRGPADHLFVFRDVTQSDNASLSGTSKLCDRIIVREKPGRASRL